MQSISLNYALLLQIATPNVNANFSEPGADNIVGLDSLSSFLQHSLQGLQSQHALGTLHVRFTGAESALAEMYLTATFFDRGTLKGQVYADNGIYRDEMVLNGEGERWMRERKTMQVLVSIFF